jgi:hypothetical protein
MDGVSARSGLSRNWLLSVPKGGASRGPAGAPLRRFPNRCLLGEAAVEAVARSGRTGLGWASGGRWRRAGRRGRGGPPLRSNASSIATAWREDAPSGGRPCAGGVRTARMALLLHRRRGEFPLGNAAAQQRPRPDPADGLWRGVGLRPCAARRVREPHSRCRGVLRSLGACHPLLAAELAARSSLSLHAGPGARRRSPDAP